jgi:hypothetical protein
LLQSLSILIKHIGGIEEVFLKLIWRCEIVWLFFILPLFLLFTSLGFIFI